MRRCGQLVERLAGLGMDRCLAGQRLPAADGGVDVVGVELDGSAQATGPLSRQKSRAAADKRVQHYPTAFRAVLQGVLCSNFIYAADKGGKGRWGEVFAQQGARAFSVGRKVSVKIPNIAVEKGDFNDLLRLRSVEERDTV
jgi:hypothetical protein